MVASIKIILLVISCRLTNSGLFSNEEKVDEACPETELLADCTYNSIPLYGKVKFVSSFADLKIQFVSGIPDIKVQYVSSFPDDCGEWQIVESFPDFTVQVVESFPDLKVQVVQSFPGM